VKFLCDQCKAKYQIADDKVAGRTVRMKCRKCGHMIEVRAEVTESSVSRFPPAPDDAPRPGSLATSFSAARPSRHSQAPGALAGAFQKKVRDDDDDQTVMAPAASFDASVTEEWYAAINGVPVGPMRLSELRTKVSAGAVNDDTLVWQEGFEEWRPVKTITQLAAIVREAAAPKPLTAPHTPAPPRAAMKPSPQAAARQTAPIGPAPAAVALAPARSNVVPISRGVGAGGGAAAVALAPAAALAPSPAPAPTPFAAPAADPFAGLDPFAAPSPAADPFAPPAAAPAPVADPFAMPGVVEAPRPAPVAALPLEPPPQEPRQEKKGPPLVFFAVVALAAAFGVTAAVLTFKKDEKPTGPVASATPPPATAAPSAPASAVVEAPAPTETVAAHEADAGPQKIAMATGGGSKGPVPAASASSKGGGAIDLGGLLGGSGNHSAGGPSGGPAGPSGGTGQALDAASIQKTIGTYKAAVKRKCWDGAGEGKTHANINVTVNVAPSGQVTSASATGDDPVVAKCVENHVRGWKFDGGGSTVIPFHFVRQ
jgi:predicted Zn finger-like uncharacterized protein